MGTEPESIRAAVMPLEASHRSRLGEVYVRHAPEGIRFAYLLTGDRTLAEDLVQEAFVRFVGRLHFIRNPDAFEGYLRRTIVNLSKNHIRHAVVERSYLARHATTTEEGRPDPDVPTTETIRSGLLALPFRQRAAIVLRYYEDLPERQIAEILGCRPATVRSLIARGLQQLRQIPEVLT